MPKKDLMEELRVVLKKNNETLANSVAALEGVKFEVLVSVGMDKLAKNVLKRCPKWEEPAKEAK